MNTKARYGGLSCSWGFSKTKNFKKSLDLQVPISLILNIPGESQPAKPPHAEPSPAVLPRSKKQIVTTATAPARRRAAFKLLQPLLRFQGSGVIL